MKRLSGLDNLFVMLDSERYPLHAAAIFVLDPSTAPKPFTFEVLRAHIAHLIPVLSRCVPQNPQQVRAVRGGKRVDHELAKVFRALPSMTSKNQHG
jgi:hypothetical protein